MRHRHRRRSLRSAPPAPVRRLYGSVRRSHSPLAASHRSCAARCAMAGRAARSPAPHTDRRSTYAPSPSAPPGTGGTAPGAAPRRRNARPPRGRSPRPPARRPVRRRPPCPCPVRGWRAARSGGHGAGRAPCASPASSRATAHRSGSRPPGRSVAVRRPCEGCPGRGARTPRSAPAPAPRTPVPPTRSPTSRRPARHLTRHGSTGRHGSTPVMGSTLPPIPDVYCPDSSRSPGRSPLAASSQVPRGLPQWEGPRSAAFHRSGRRRMAISSSPRLSTSRAYRGTSSAGR